MIEALSTARNRTHTFVWLGVCCALSAAAAVVGISDNPPGILVAYGAATALVLAFVHAWRSAEKFWRLLYGSALALAASAVLHNFFEAIAEQAEGVCALQLLLQGLAVAAFLVAVLVCPPAIVVGAVGSVVMLIRNRRRPKPDRDTSG